MEVTEKQTAQMLIKTKTKKAHIESNNGGEGFARNVKKLVPSGIAIKPFYQALNKESRIYSNSATVNNEIVFPNDWHIRWPGFYKAVTKFKKVFTANKNDDAPDALTGIILKANEKPLTLSPNANLDDLGLF